MNNFFDAIGIDLGILVVMLMVLVLVLIVLVLNVSLGLLVLPDPGFPCQHNDAECGQQTDGPDYFFPCHMKFMTALIMYFLLFPVVFL